MKTTRTIQIQVESEDTGVVSAVDTSLTTWQLQQREEHGDAVRITIGVTRNVVAVQ
jgi:hypothetical protein